MSCPDFPTHIEVTGEAAYIRWYGKREWYRSGYSKEELQEWAEIIRQLEKEVGKVYGYFNNDFGCYAPKNCLDLRKILNL